MATRTEKWLQQIANRQGTKNVCADNGFPFCLPLPPTGTDVHPLLLLPLLPRPVFLPLIPLAPAPVAVPGPAPHHQLHHHTCQSWGNPGELSGREVSIFSIFSCPHREKFQTILNRTILKFDALPIAHFKTYVPLVLKHLWKLAMSLKLWVPAHFEVG